MKRLNLWLGIALIAAVPLVSGCKEETAQAEHPHPATVEHLEGSDLSRVTLTEHAMQRLDVRTGAVTQETSPRSQSAQLAVPYSSLLYDSQGNTWVYSSPEPRVFVREKVDVDFIEGDIVYLAAGPEIGTNVATFGVAELYGSEFPVGH